MAKINKCLICDGDVIDNYSAVGDKGIRGLVNASILRNSEKSVDIEYKKGGVVHKSCRKVYTRHDSTKRTLKEAVTDQEPLTSQDAPRLRSRKAKLNFKSD